MPEKKKQNKKICVVSHGLSLEDTNKIKFYANFKESI